MVIAVEKFPLYPYNNCIRTSNGMMNLDITPTDTIRTILRNIKMTLINVTHFRKYTIYHYESDVNKIDLYVCDRNVETLEITVNKPLESSEFDTDMR